MLTKTLISIGLAWSIVTGPAQDAVKRLENRLWTDFSQQKIWTGQYNQNAVVNLYLARDTWSLWIVSPDDETRFVAAGNDWWPVPLPPQTGERASP